MRGTLPWTPRCAAEMDCRIDDRHEFTAHKKRASRHERSGGDFAFRYIKGRVVPESPTLSETQLWLSKIHLQPGSKPCSMRRWRSAPASATLLSRRPVEAICNCAIRCCP